jgi:tRNA nucleotidyltransferase (CCA-adding enzyme)
MAVGLTPSDWGLLMDPFDGRADVADGVVRVLHPGSFTDDPTRMLRAVRYSRRLGFRLDSETEALVRRDAHRLWSVSGDRVRRELERLLAEGRAASMLEMAQGLGVLHAIHPSLELSGHALERLRDVGAARAGDGGLLFAAVIALSAAVGGVEPLLHRLNVGVGWAKAARDTVRLRGEIHRLAEPEMAPSRIFRVLEGAHPTAVSAWAWALVSDDPLVARRLERFESELRHVSTLLDGNDLIALGVEEGPLVGELLAELRRKRLDGELSTAEEEREYVVGRVGGSD